MCSSPGLNLSFGVKSSAAGAGLLSTHVVVGFGSGNAGPPLEPIVVPGNGGIGIGGSAVTGAAIGGTIIVGFGADVETLGIGFVGAIGVVGNGFGAGNVSTDFESVGMTTVAESANDVFLEGFNVAEGFESE